MHYTWERGHKSDRSKQCDQYKKWVDRQQNKKNSKSIDTYNKTFRAVNSNYNKQGEEEVSTVARNMETTALLKLGPSMKNNLFSEYSKNEKSDFDKSLAHLELQSDIFEREM